MTGAAVLCVALSSPAHGGVWVREQGDAWLQGGVSASTSGSVFGPDGTRLSPSDPAIFGDAGVLFEGARYVGVDVSGYGEVGLGHGVELAASLPARYASQRWTWAVGGSDPILHDHLGLGDLTAGARLGTVTHGVALSVYAGGRVPLYDNNPGVLRTAPANSDFYDDRVPLGQGTIDGEALGAVGTSTGPLHGWFLVEGGVRVRNRGFSAVVPARVQLGLDTEPIDAWLGASAAVSLGNGEAPDAYLDAWGKGPLVVDNSSWLTAEAGVLVPIAGPWAALASASQVLAARRWASLTQGTLGLAWSGPLWSRP